jgi:hypothetical protein
VNARTASSRVSIESKFAVAARVVFGMAGATHETAGAALATCSDLATLFSSDSRFVQWKSSSVLPSGPSADVSSRQSFQVVSTTKCLRASTRSGTAAVAAPPPPVPVPPLSPGMMSVSAFQGLFCGASGLPAASYHGPQCPIWLCSPHKSDRLGVTTPFFCSSCPMN